MGERFGYSARILWIDLTDKRAYLEEREEDFWRQYVGGGLVATALLLDKTPPSIDPLGPDNLLILASSVVRLSPRIFAAPFSPLTRQPVDTAPENGNVELIVFLGAEKRNNFTPNGHFKQAFMLRKRTEGDNAALGVRQRPVCKRFDCTV